MKIDMPTGSNFVSTFSTLFITSIIFSPAASAENLSVSIDGSSTVYPITEAVAEEFGRELKGARVTVGVSGTGGGFKKFCRQETDFSNASRTIKESEAKLCAKNGVQFIEIPVAYDAISVVVNKENTWAKEITISELKKLWEPAAKGKIKKWNDIRADWPAEKIDLYAPGVDSGTFDYFTEVVVGESQASRSDFTASEDDNVLVQGVAGNKNALGFFGLAYFEENQDKIRALNIDDGKDSNGKGGQAPTRDNVLQGRYQPLARPLFLYVSKAALKKPVIKKFTEFYLSNAAELASEVGYVQLPKKEYGANQTKLKQALVSSIPAHPSKLSSTEQIKKTLETIN